MRYFKEKQKVNISEDKISKAKEFAEKVVDTVNYGDSNQFSKSKIQDDHFISKVGEEAVTSIYKNFSDSVSEPDYNVYNANKKNWDADLRIDDLDLAVKTQKRSQSVKYGLSWTFQSSGVRRDPILNDMEAWVCFVECDDTSNFNCDVYPAFQIKELTFGEPKLDYLKGKKKVVYAEKLPLLKK